MENVFWQTWSETAPEGLDLHFERCRNCIPPFLLWPWEEEQQQGAWLHTLVMDTWATGGWEHVWWMGITRTTKSGGVWGTWCAGVLTCVAQSAATQLLQPGVLQPGYGCMFQEASEHLETWNTAPLCHIEHNPGSLSSAFCTAMVSGWWRPWPHHQAFLQGGSGCSAAAADTQRRWLRSACVPVTYGWAVKDCKHNLYCTEQLQTFKPLLSFYCGVLLLFSQAMLAP